MDTRRTLLDGGWWPRSTDPFAELPGLMLAIDKIHGPITQLILGRDGWDPRPGRLPIDSRILRVTYFASQPAALLTALRRNGDRVDLLVVPPDTSSGVAEAAMALAASPVNRLHAPTILQTARTHPADDVARLPEEVWETEGGSSPATRAG